MNSLKLSLATPAQPKGRILVIEPDVRRATSLRTILREGIELEIVARVPDALRSLAKRIPDLVLTSTLLPPADAASLMAQVKRMPAAAHVQMITLPYFIDSDGSDAATSHPTVLNFLRRRSALARPRCDVGTLREQIEEYLSQARRIRQDLDSRQSNHGHHVESVKEQSTPGMWLTRASAARAIPAAVVATSTATHSQHAAAGMPPDRRRTRRRTAGDVPWLWTVKLPGDSRVKLVDISGGGVLLETTSRIVDGSTLELQVFGKDTNVCVPARMVRNCVAAVDGLGVRYHVAVAFARELDLLGLQSPSTSSPSPNILGDVLTRVLSEVDRDANSAALRFRFEKEVRRLLPVRDIQIRQTPVIAERGLESIYFTVPHGSGTQPILQAIFEPDYVPTAVEFQLLKAAATLAAVVLEFAPLGDSTRSR